MPISALQHLIFCERQCALIHVEGIWRENRFTQQGRILHEKIHTDTVKTSGHVRTEYSVQLRSLEHGLFGKADIVEYHRTSIRKKYPAKILPIEYKRGSPKSDLSDSVQLCAQALCLEEMLGAEIEAGEIFYGKTRRRKAVQFDDHLRQITKAAALRLHEIIEQQSTPPPQYKDHCERCSLFDICKPRLFTRKKSAAAFIQQHIDSLMKDEISGEI